MIEIPLTRGKVALIDDDDAEAVLAFQWHAHRNSKDLWYAMQTVKHRSTGSAIYLHRVILNAPPETKVDHKNGDGLDNRRANLRIATHAENLRNSGLSSNNSSGFKGVSFVRHRFLSKPWHARIMLNRKQTHLGYFATAEDAARAYDAKAKELFGEFARVNFP